MAIQSELRTLLGLIVGSRFHPNAALDRPAPPYIVYSRISAIKNLVLDTNGGTNNLVQTSIQLDIYASTYAEAVTISGQVQTALAGWNRQNIVTFEQDFYEPDESLHRIMLEVSIWHR